MDNFSLEFAVYLPIYSQYARRSIRIEKQAKKEKVMVPAGRFIRAGMCDGGQSGI